MLTSPAWGWCVSVAGLMACLAPSAAAQTVLDFEDLPAETFLSGTNYRGLTWEAGPPGFNNRAGGWQTPTEIFNYPLGSRNVMNAWGSTPIGIGFPNEVDVSGAYFAGQGFFTTSWAKGVRVHGYRAGAEVATTDWFRDIDTVPDFFAMNLRGVDRIVFEADPATPQPGETGTFGWFGMDNLTFTNVPEPAGACVLAMASALVLLRRCRLTRGRLSRPAR